MVSSSSTTTTTTATTTSLASFPEELLERILALSLSPPPLILHRPSWHFHHTTSHTHKNPLFTAPLLVSKSWLRIATPLIYNSLHIHSPAHAALLARTFTANPALASSSRRLVVSGVWPELAPVARACSALEILDITLDASCSLEIHALLETKTFCDSLSSLDITHLVVRKANVYLSQPKPRHIIAGLARAIPRWSRLVRLFLALPPPTSSLNLLSLRQRHTSISAFLTMQQVQVLSSRRA